MHGAGPTSRLCGGKKEGARRPLETGGVYVTSEGKRSHNGALNIRVPDAMASSVKNEQWVFVEERNAILVK
jgi:hypothetical protein